MMMIIIKSYNYNYNDMIQISKMSMGVIVEEVAEWIELSNNCHMEFICINPRLSSDKFGSSPISLSPKPF